MVDKHTPEDGINSVRMQFNKFYFDENHCKDGLNALRFYKADFDHKNNVLRRRPLHNWASHRADAMRIAVVGAMNWSPDAMDDLEEPETDWVV